MRTFQGMLPFFLGGALCAAPPVLAAQVSSVPSPPATQNTVNTSNTVAEQNSVRSLGYRYGFEAGQSDFKASNPYDYQSHSTFSQGSYGYQQAGPLSLEDYRYNFRYGYERGYDDGYHGRQFNSNINATQPVSNRNATFPVQTPLGQPQSTTYGNVQSESQVQHATGTVPSGTVLQLHLNTTLSTRSSKAGDPFSATVVSPVRDAQGRILIPDGSLVRGEVASVQRAGKLTGSGRLQLRFQQLVLPDGHTASLTAQLGRVQNGSSGVTGAIASATEGSTSTNTEGGVQRSRTRQTVGDVAAGGAVGSIIGAIAGGGKGAGIGAAVGAGLGVVLASQHGAAVDLKPGTAMTITLSQPLYVQ